MSKDIDESVDDISNDIGISEDAADAVSPPNIREIEETTASEEKCTSCEQIEHETGGRQHNTSGGSNADTDIVSNIEDSDIDVFTCANCGKAGATNTCNKCKSVKYCNAACKKRHRSKHKKDCEEHLKRAAELREEETRRAAELRDIELFKQPPTIDEECPICFLHLPLFRMARRYQSCCGKEICTGCIHAMDNKLCPFCRIPTPDTNDEVVKRTQKRVDAGDAQAMFNLGGYYSQGMYGLAQDYTKGLELYRRAAELSHVEAYHNIGNLYYHGNGVERDIKKAIHYYEIAAMKGDTIARHSLGALEQNAGNTERAIKHYIIAVEGGSYPSLRNIRLLYSNGHVTKDEYAKTLRAYQKYLDEVKSNQRDQAASARGEDYKYYIYP